MKTLLATLLCAAALYAADVNRRAPGFSLPDSKRQLHDLADYRGKIVILEFMQTNCPHCAAFAPVLDKVQAKYGDRVAILSVVLPPDDQSKVAQYIAGHGIKYPIIFDCGQMAYSYILAPTMQFPHIFLIDGSGMIRKDYLYDALTHDIFEGNGLFQVLDGMLAAAKKK
jgi:peroxiredoxin